MCGIVAAVAKRNVVSILLEGLRCLEYRGYDSAGMAVVNGSLHMVRSVGRVSALAELAQQAGVAGTLGIAHTRWATHGAPSERNAHPHASLEGIAVVHNGIIENHELLRKRLVQEGYVFSSETDTEVIAHLIHSHYKTTRNLLTATSGAVAELTGAYAVAVVTERDDQRVVVARRGSPLLIGLSGDEVFAASDASALVQVTRRMVNLEDGDIAELSTAGVKIIDEHGETVHRIERESELSAQAVELAGYCHYMQKEIFEQPAAVKNTLATLSETIDPALFGMDAGRYLKDIDSVTILGCGTSYHAGLVGRYWIEALARLPVNVEIASEFRYRDSVPNDRSLIVTISQSGETADTIAALQQARALGQQRTLAICNVPESSLVRQSLLTFMTRAGPELGVASTKAFVTQLTALLTLALVLAKLRCNLTAEREREMLTALRNLPTSLSRALALEPGIKQWAQAFASKRDALFLGRGVHYPIALEGALKLKEITYIHAEAYPAGELKHGPLALIDRDMPVIVVAPNDSLLAKLKSNMQEVSARGGELYVLADANSELPESEGVHILRLDGDYGAVSPIVHALPLQLLAYHTALIRGTDVDKPRNLAKSVTVE
jgi:glucosamine--fructose-6-phosphate aminotransferase (isomerizing)